MTGTTKVYLPLCALLAATMTACAHTQAAVPPEVTALDVPLPPPRSVETFTAEIPQTVEAPTGLAPTNIDDSVRGSGTTPSSVARGSSRGGDTAKPAEAAKPEVVAAEPPKPEGPRPQASPLRTTPTQQEQEVENDIRADAKRAATDLSRVDYRLLGQDGRGQYDTATGYLKQLEDALRSKNLPLARSLAEKARTIAAQLAPR